MGKVIVVGIGPGGYEDMTIRADEALQACDAIVGYPVYVDLVRDRYPGKELHSTPMTRETERCQLVLELARSGKTAAMVCSGDSGIYGMAALVYQLRGEAQEPEVEAIPGLTAACSGGALLGGAHPVGAGRHKSVHIGGRHPRRCTGRDRAVRPDAQIDIAHPPPRQRIGNAPRRALLHLLCSQAAAPLSEIYMQYCTRIYGKVQHP